MENLFDYICEAVFSKDAWKHRGAYDYPVALISDILSTGKVSMGNKGDESIDLDLSAKDKKELADIQSHVTDDNAMERFDSVMSKFGVSFTKIFKGKFSGHSGRGMEGQIFESLVCYLFNDPNGDINKWLDKFKAPNSDMWIDNSINSAKIIRSFIDTNYGSADDYIAIHVDGENFDQYSKLILDIASIFRGKGKNGLGALIGIKNASDLYNGSSKDKWNPADIVLIKNDPAALQDALDAIIAGNSGTATNSVLVTKLGEGLIIPISLKKIGDSGKIYGHHIDNAEFMDEHEITLTKIKLAKRYSKGITGNFVVIGITEDGVPSEIEIRAQTGETGHDNLSIEVVNASGKSRGGKGISVVKKALGIKDNSYYANFADNDELFKKFEKYGFVDENDKPIDECPANLSETDLYKRTCFRGFFGLLETFEKQVKNNPKLKSSYGKGDDLLLNFTQFLWNACTDCPGSYYILK